MAVLPGSAPRLSRTAVCLIRDRLAPARSTHLERSEVGEVTRRFRWSKKF